jgi:predicted transcriptional regulator
MTQNTYSVGENVTVLITKQELAKNLRITQRSVDNLTNKGIINRIKVGANSRYDWLQVVQSLKSQAQA